METQLQASEQDEHLDEGSESAPEVNEEAEAPQADDEEAQQATKDEAPSDDDDGEDPDWYVQAINRQHKKYRDEERRRLELEQELNRVRGELPKQDGRPDVPPPPDPFDDNYEQKIEARDKAIREAAEWDARSQAQQMYERQQQEYAHQQRAQQLRSTMTQYAQRAETYGVKPEELQVAGNAVATMGISDDVAMHILGDEKGPLVTTYLARHPADLERMNNMSPMQAAVYLETKVKPNAEKAHGISKAPKPPESLEGGGAPAPSRGPKGATFE